MSKKLMGLNVAENLVRQNKMSKIREFSTGKKFTTEAARYIAEEIGIYSDAYPFEELYGTFEEYVNSKMALRLYNQNNSGELIDWIADFPSNSNELIELYNNSTKEVKAIIFKTSVYRKRVVNINKKIIPNYLNCFDALLDITQDNLDNMSSDSALDYLMYWSQTISLDWFKRAEKIREKSHVIQLAKNRFENRARNYSSNKMGAIEAVEIQRYLKENNELIDLFKLKDFLNPTYWSFGKDKETTIEKIKEVYKLTVGSLLDGKYSGYPILRIVGNMAPICVLYEDNEEMINKLFVLGVKICGFTGFVENLCYYSRAMDFTPTTFMEEMSIVYAQDWRHLLLKTPITTAEELVQYHKNWFVGQEILNGFGGNTTLFKAIDFNKFTEEDFEVLDQYLNWERMEEFFKDDIIPYEIIMKYGHKIGNSIARSCKTGKFSVKQTLSILDKYGYRMENYEIHNIINRILYASETLTPEEIADLIKRSPRKDFDIAVFDGYNNATLKSVLTLL